MGRFRCKDNLLSTAGSVDQRKHAYEQDEDYGDKPKLDQRYVDQERVKGGAGIGRSQAVQ